MRLRAFEKFTSCFARRVRHSSIIFKEIFLSYGKSGVWVKRYQWLMVQEYVLVPKLLTVCRNLLFFELFTLHTKRAMFNKLKGLNQAGIVLKQIIYRQGDWIKQVQTTRYLQFFFMVGSERIITKMLKNLKLHFQISQINITKQ